MIVGACKSILLKIQIPFPLSSLYINYLSKNLKNDFTKLMILTKLTNFFSKCELFINIYLVTKGNMCLTEKLLYFIILFSKNSKKMTKQSHYYCILMD